MVGAESAIGGHRLARWYQRASGAMISAHLVAFMASQSAVRCYIFIIVPVLVFYSNMLSSSVWRTGEECPAGILRRSGRCRC
jgi:hypothetical protein